MDPLAAKTISQGFSLDEQLNYFARGELVQIVDAQRAWRAGSSGGRKPPARLLTWFCVRIFVMIAGSIAAIPEVYKSWQQATERSSNRSGLLSSQ